MNLLIRLPRVSPGIIKPTFFLRALANERSCTPKAADPAAADYLGDAESTLEKKRLTGDGPPFIRLGRVIVYDTRDLERLACRAACRGTSEPTEA